MQVQVSALQLLTCMSVELAESLTAPWTLAAGGGCSALFTGPARMRVQPSFRVLKLRGAFPLLLWNIVHNVMYIMHWEGHEMWGPAPRQFWAGRGGGLSQGESEEFVEP